MNKFISYLLPVMVAAVCLFSSTAFAKRYALVIGNSAYSAGALKNPVNDATDMAALLRTKHFDVQVLTDAGRRDMESAISAFTRKLYQKNAIGLFYYAGHGIEIDGQNYLIPVDARIENETDVIYSTVNAGRVLDGMSRAENPLNLVILDACRNNPFTRGFRSASRGLARMDAAKGSLILYATSPGEVAADGDGRNGLFTQHLMKAIQQPGLKVEEVFKTTAKMVYRDSAKKQLPWQSGVILGDFYFTTDLANPKAKTVTLNPPSTNRLQDENLFWDSIKNETDPDYFRSYLKKYPDGLYAELARLRIASAHGEARDSMTEKTPAASVARLTVNTRPKNARIRLLNSELEYREGMELEPGRYQLEVSQPGYQSHTEWLALAVGLNFHTVVLDEETKFVPAKTVFDTNRHLPDMVTIQAGCYQMGSPDTEPGRDDDETLHRVCLKSFEIGAKEVTVRQFQRFVDATGYRTDAEKNVEKPGCWAYGGNENKWTWQTGHYWRMPGFVQTEQDPVVCVSWNDVNAYLDWFNQESGQTYRLPTEAEWEYAARGGTKTAYFWGDSINAGACRYANIADQSHDWSVNFPCDDGQRFTSRVGRYRANNYGVYDISGNNWEWTCSGYDKNYQGGEQRCLGKTDVTANIQLAVRGGAYDSEPRWVRVANRNLSEAWSRYSSRGFRLARTP